MATNTERERKFLLKPEEFETYGFSKSFIEQAYLAIDNVTGNHTRLRITDFKKAEITHKNVISAEIKEEHNFDVSLADAHETMTKSALKLQKVRYSREIMQQGPGYNGRYDVDIYPDGTMIIEIEYYDDWLYNLHQNEHNLPKFCGKEITGLKSYSNITLATIEANKYYDFSKDPKFPENIKK